ncbi:hypothetical protein PIB30_049594 [Stylosanthes scabra]|uniref:NAB domain-containing protein n=1 Tax=Stylosanthes scabra TaxID=79078 RepID=A0ABU6VFW6_9FABA|nr:hypothetical protein [Stylosanthes scabra]
MLQRAATNAYTWWWASHVRTKQSKWLEQSIQDVEDKASEVLQIIDNTGDSFAQRAEMYYKKKPELLNFVEETLKAYRSLAQRFDHISKELQSANRQLATVFPEQVQYRMDDDDEFDVSYPATNASSPDTHNQTQKPDISQAGNTRKQNSRSYSMLLSRKGPSRKIAGFEKYVPTGPTSGFSKAEAHAEVDKLQKEILALQTEKEFVRSLYEGSYDKYWEIEDRITGIQKIVGELQDEFGISTVIEDNEARTLMATTALNSCKVTVTRLQKEHVQSTEEAKTVFQKVKESHERFKTLKEELVSIHSIQLDQVTETDLSSIDIEEELAALEDESQDDTEFLKEDIMERLEQDSGMSHTMTEIVALIDKLVNKVVFLETAVSSHNLSVKRLLSETEKFQANIERLEENKELLLEDSERSKKLLKELEEELRRVKVLNRSVRMQENNLQTNFTEASYTLENLSGKLKTAKAEENFSPYKKRSEDNLAITKDVETKTEENEDYVTNQKEDYATNLSDTADEDNKSNSEENTDFMTESISEEIEQEKNDLVQTTDSVDIKSAELNAGEEEDQPNSQQMYVSELDDREKILFEEYTSVLQDYKLVKVKLYDAEKKNSETINDLELQLNELKKVISMKNEEINTLQQKLNDSEETPAETPHTPPTEYKDSPQDEETLLQNETQEASMQEHEIPSSAVEESARSSFADADQPQEAESKEDSTTSFSPTDSMLQQVVTPHNIENQQTSLSPVEKKFRSYIDDLMEENLEFWLRFSTAVHQIQRFQNCIHDLNIEIRNIKANRRPEGNIQSEIKPIYRHLREIRTELSLWLEHNAVLQEELQTRHPTLFSLQDEIARAANPVSATERAMLSEYQAAKFQGEVLHMKQESNRILSELQGGLTFVKGLKVDVEKNLEEMSQELGVNKPGQGSPHVHTKQHHSRTRIPLRSFLFGVKLKKHSHSSSSSHVNAATKKSKADSSTAIDATL